MTRLLVLAMAVVTLTLGSCSADTPPVCESVDALKASYEDLKQVDLTTEGGLTELTKSLDAVAQALADVKADAKTEFASELTAVESSYDGLEASVTAARADRSLAALTAVKDALTQLRSSVETLVSDVQSTC